MRRLPFLLLTLLLVLAVSGLCHAQSLTLPEVVRLALARNERARLAGLAVTSADAAVSKARAGFLPSVTMTGGETLRPFTVQQGERTTVRSNAASGNLTISQPLLSASTFPLVASARHNLEAARHNQVDLRRQLCFDAVRAFFGVIAQQRVFAAAQRRLDRADNSLADTHARVVAQLVSSNDETRALVERATALQSVAGATGALAQSRVSLEYVIDVPVAEDLQPPAERLVPETLKVSGLAGQALSTRPDLAASRESVAAAEASAEEPSLRLIPTVSAQAQGKVADQSIAGDRQWDTTFLLSLNWAIWDAGVRSADASSRRALADTATLQMQALRRRIQADVKAAASSLEAARMSVQAAELGVDASRRSADETAVLYKQGLAKAIELFNANQATFDAEVAMAAAQLSLRQAELDVRSALGLFPIDGVQ